LKFKKMGDRNKRLRTLSYVGALFMAAYVSLPGYINSSFLKKFTDEEGIGWLYAIASIITIILMLVTPSLIRRFGNRAILRILVALSIVSIIPLAYPQKVIHTLTAFVVYIILGYLTRYVLDVYLENVSDNRHTGGIRGLYMTFYNTAWLISPLIASYLASQGLYTLVYGLAGAMMLPLLAISILGLKEMKCPEKVCLSAWASVKKLFIKTDQTTRDIRRILIIDFLLNFFYAVMVVYMPLYLKNQIGLSWNEIGLAFTVMLLPFVLFELPLGKLADKFLGEKEILMGGIIIIGLATIACSYLFSPVWFLWAILLFVTRTGAASIEIMKEAYLFKKISGTDAGIVSLSRINVPFSYIVGPIFVTPILASFGLRYVFLGLGLIMLSGLIFTFRLKDTK